jgi:hypothetical protein
MGMMKPAFGGMREKAHAPLFPYCVYIGVCIEMSHERFIETEYQQMILIVFVGMFIPDYDEDSVMPSVLSET